MRWHALHDADDPTVPRPVEGWRLNKDPWSWITHFGGMVLALVGLAFLVLDSRAGAGPAKLTGMAIYGGSLALCMATSALYHFLDIGHAGNRWLRRADHCAIFLLIGGTFVPAALHLLDGTWRTATLVSVASFAAAGILFKLIWIDAPRWLGTGIYVAMGWAAVIPGVRMFPVMETSALVWLFAGGAFYTLGAVVYGTKRPDPLPNVFGFHEVWHVFVLAGAVCHYFFAHSFCDLTCPPL